MVCDYAEWMRLVKVGSWDGLLSTSCRIVEFHGRRCMFRLTNQLLHSQKYMYITGRCFASLSEIRAIFVSLTSPLHFYGFCDHSLGPGLQPTHRIVKRVGKIAKSDC